MSLMLQILPHCELGIDAGGLKGDADLPADVVGTPGQIETEHRGTPRLNWQECAQDAEESRLAAAVWPQETEDRSRFDREIDAIERQAFAIAMREAADFNRGRHGSRKFQG